MNKKWLLQDIRFPLHWGSEDYKTFVFDADNEMVAQTDYEVLDATKEYHPFEQLIGEYKDVPEPPNPKYNQFGGDFFDISTGGDEPIGLVRGWGHLSNKYRNKKGVAEKRQDNVAEYIYNVINCNGC
tara:strand:+ start:216036 stop:216416 length:381 start_codon:yes stop_codon:yes gene_type:complete